MLWSRPCGISVSTAVSLDLQVHSGYVGHSEAFIGSIMFGANTQYNPGKST